MNGEPASRALAWRDRWVPLETTPGPEGVRWAGNGADGVVLVAKGMSAMVAGSGQPALGRDFGPAG